MGLTQLPFLYGLQHQILVIEDVVALVYPTLSLLHYALRLIVFYESCLLFFGENGGLHVFLSLVFETPHQNPFRPHSPELFLVVIHVVDVLGVTDVDLVRFSQEGIIPDLDKGIVTDTEEEVTVQIESDSVELVAMQSCHLYFNGHLDSVISPDRGILENNP